MVLPLGHKTNIGRPGRNFIRPEKVITARRGKVEEIAEAPVRYEAFTGEECQQMVEGKPLDKPTAGDLLAIEQGKRPGAETPASPAKMTDGPTLRALPQPG
jgi:hypothetical protein